MADTYEGWSNRETWATNLWLANDQGLYEQVREMALEELCAAVERVEGGPSDHKRGAVITLATRLEDMFAEFAHGDGEDDYVPAPGLYKMLEDIGSLYRVEWEDVAQGWVEDAAWELTRGGGR